ncbi:gamma-aminobutyraldehyde dehydrogenase [Rhodococcus sp. NPDC056960]|uniref:gamma-aminobutyraldehyde dehydrogenase n=1 Tax=Rhodococcus sp. NPDC056960 TaxID=3345982 RepID=UPI0036342876
MYQFINGQRTQGSSGFVDVVDPSTGLTITQVDLAGADDVDRAVSAARQAFSTWSRLTPAERAGALTRLAQIVTDKADAFADVESRQAGKPITLATEFDVPGTIDNIAFFAGAARNLEGKAAAEYSGDHTSMIRREPVGVIGSIAPWNYPLQMAAWKILPAVAAGNTIVLKSSELTPLTTVMLAEACTEAGIPPGVVNVLTGTGELAGAALTAHPDVAMVSFTGSTAVGRAVMKAASAQAKRVHLELGGKAPFVVFDDADLDAAIHGAVAGSLINTGQDCTAATRAYIQRPLYEQFVAGVQELMTQVRPGPTNERETTLGPLVSTTQRDRVAHAVEHARATGAKIVCGGKAPDGMPEHSAYYEPTLVVDADQRSDIVQKEVFGPVLAVLPFDDDHTGLALANDNDYGLAASAWTSDLNRAMTATREINAGCVWINDHIPMTSEMPHGGVGRSGFGKDMSTYAFDEYTNVKHAMIDVTGVARKGWHRIVLGDVTA